MTSTSTGSEREGDDEAERGRYKLRALLAFSEVASSLSTDADIDDLLRRYLGTMMRIAGACAGTVRVLTADGGHLRLAAALGLPPEVLEQERVVPLDCGTCGLAVLRGEEICSHDLKRFRQSACSSPASWSRTGSIAAPSSLRS